MQMYALSPLHILSMAVAAGFVAALYLLFRNAAGNTKRNIVILLMAANIFQHLFKHVLYPHLFGTLFRIDNTLYNACAFLILFSPVLHFGRSGSARQFLAYTGTAAGAIAIAVPFWFFGKDISTPSLISEYVRFYLCHALLFASSLLPALWGRVRFRYLDAWKFGLYFLGMLCMILVNNVIFLIALDGTTDDLYQKLLQRNALGLMGPPRGNSPFNGLIGVFEKLSPPFFLGGDGKPYAPILWYLFPGYFGLTVIGVVLGAMTDRKNFIADQKMFFGIATPPRPMRPARHKPRRPSLKRLS